MPGSHAANTPISPGGIAFSADGRLLAVVCGNGVVELVDLKVAVVIARLECPLRLNMPELALASDGTRILLPDCKGHILHLWDLRKVREELAAIGLDWDLPPYSPPPPTEDPAPLRVELDMGDLEARS